MNVAKAICEVAGSAYLVMSTTYNLKTKFLKGALNETNRAH